jgi:hypothetical protein
MVVTPRGRLVIRDELAAAQPRTWSWLLHSDWPSEQVSGRVHVIRSGPAQAWVTRLGPNGVGVTTGQSTIEANPTASTPALAITKNLQVLRWTTPRLVNAEFLAAIEPTSALDPAPATATKLPGSAVGFDDEQVYFGPRIETPGLAAEAIAVIRSGDQLAVVGATRVVVDGRNLHESVNPFTGLLDWPR